MPACSQTGKLSEARHQERKPDMQNDWTKPAALAIPEGGFFPDKVEQGRYGPIYPKTPACYGFSILAMIKPVRDHQCPSFLEYGEYPYVSADEIKKALRLKAAFSGMLDQMQ